MGLVISGENLLLPTNKWCDLVELGRAKHREEIEGGEDIQCDRMFFCVT